MSKLRLILFSISISLSLGSIAQSVSPATLNSTGGTYFFTYYRFEWSFGESMAINTMTNANSNVWVTNGILQPNTHNPATISNVGTWDKDEIKILPNPTQNVIQINFFSKQQGKIIMNLYDESGRFMGTRQFDYYGNGSIQRWDLSRFASGAFFLNIQLQPTGKSVAKKGSFKILKIK